MEKEFRAGSEYDGVEDEAVSEDLFSFETRAQLKEEGSS